MGAAGGVGCGRGHGFAVASDHFDAHAAHGLAAADGLDEDVAAAVLPLFDDEAEIGNQNQARVFDAALVVAFFAAIPAFLRAPLGRRNADVEQEQAALVLRLVQKILADIDTVEDWFAGLAAAVIARGSEALYDGILQIVHLRFGEVPHPRRHVLQLIGQHPSHFHLHPVDIAHQEAHLPVAPQRQQRALAEKRECLPVRGYLDGCGVGLG